MKLIDRLRPAFDEAWVYPCVLLGIVASPVVITAALGQTPARLAVHWYDFVTSLVVAVIVLMAYEMRGTAEGKKTATARWRRYGFAFLGGLAWRQVVPAVLNLISNLVASAIGGGA
jgi:hypothetical protein